MGISYVRAVVCRPNAAKEHPPMYDFREKSRPRGEFISTPGAMRKTVGLSHGCCEGAPLDL
jgi:hypothetical protein